MKNLKKVLAIAFAVILLASTSTEPVYAADNGTIYEAENATFSTPYKAWTVNYDGIYETIPAAVVYTGAAYAGNASNGLVGSFNVTGNSLTWEVEAEADGTVDFVLSVANNYNAVIYQTDAEGNYVVDPETGLYVPTGKYYHTELPLTGNVELIVNGTAIDLDGIVVPGEGVVDAFTFNHCVEVTVPDVVLKEGANTVTLKVAPGHDDVTQYWMAFLSVSVDYLKVTNFEAAPVDDGNEDDGNSSAGGTATGGTEGDQTSGSETENDTIKNTGDAGMSVLMSVLFLGLAFVVVGFAKRKIA